MLLLLHALFQQGASVHRPLDVAPPNGSFSRSQTAGHQDGGTVEVEEVVVEGAWNWRSEVRASEWGEISDGPYILQQDELV